MRSCKIPIYIVLLLFMFGGTAHSQLIIDSVNYAIDIGDAFGDAGDTVEIPIQIKNAIDVGGLLIRFTYDSDLLRPLPMEIQTMPVPDMFVIHRQLILSQ